MMAVIPKFDAEYADEDIKYFEEQMESANWYIEYYSRYDDEESVRLKEQAEERKKRYQRQVELLRDALTIYKLTRTENVDAS